MVVIFLPESDLDASVKLLTVYHILQADCVKIPLKVKAISRAARRTHVRKPLPGYIRAYNVHTPASVKRCLLKLSYF